VNQITADSKKKQVLFRTVLIMGRTGLQFKQAHNHY